MHTQNNNAYFPVLDVLKTIAAYFLLWTHVSQKWFGAWADERFFVLPLPDSCVYIFFVISGFLAGRKAETIHLHSWIQRRLKRLLPAYYAYILLCSIFFVLTGRTAEILQAQIGYYLVPMPQVPFCQGNAILPFVHLWFIGSMLIFTLVFPCIAKLNAPKRFCVSVIICVGWMLLKWGCYFLVGKDTFLYKFVGVTGFDCLFLGVLCGLETKKLHENKYAWAYLLWVLFLTFGLYDTHIPAPARPEVLAILCALIILFGQADMPGLRFRCALWHKFSSISYEFYIVQIGVLLLLSHAWKHLPHQPADIVIYAICTFFTTFGAWLLHKIYKKTGVFIANFANTQG